MKNNIISPLGFEEYIPPPNTIILRIDAPDSGVK